MRFDSHAHLDDAAFHSDIQVLMQELKDTTRVLVPGVNVSSFASLLTLIEDQDHIFAAAGIHPSEVQEAGRLSEVEGYLHHPKVKAVGEIGLDYYWVSDNKEAQIALFRAQLELAKAHALPVIIHDRDAHEDVLHCLKQVDSFQSGVIMHAFSGSAEMAQEYVRLGAYISLAGPVTFKNARVPKEVARVVPLSQLLVETDAPYLTPHPLRGRRNDPRLLGYIIAEIAHLKECSIEQVEDATYANAVKVFKL